MGGWICQNLGPLAASLAQDTAQSRRLSMHQGLEDFGRAVSVLSLWPLSKPEPSAPLCWEICCDFNGQKQPSEEGRARGPNSWRNVLDPVKQMAKSWDLPPNRNKLYEELVLHEQGCRTELRDHLTKMKYFFWFGSYFPSPCISQSSK